MIERLARLLKAVLPLLELRALIVIVLLGTAAWVFIELADEVIEGEAIAFDETLLLALRSSADPANPLGPVWLEEMVRDVTALGGYTILSIVASATVIYLLMTRQLRLALFFLASTIGAIFWIHLLKYGFDRPRPDLVPHGMTAATASFPSGHSAAAAAFYLTIGVLLARFQQRQRLRIFFVGLAVFLTVLVGFSRVYLGVHWPSDVLAGWSLGGGWALLCWLAATWLRRRHVLPMSNESTAAEPAFDQVREDVSSASSGPAATTAANPRAGGSSRSS